MHFAIDTHSHFNDGHPFDHAVDRFTTLTPEFLRKEYDACHVAAGCFSSFGSVCSTQGICGENEIARELSEQYPWFYFWTVVVPDQPETFEQAKRLLEHPKCVGIKIHPPYHGYKIADQGDKIFSFAADLGATVLMHPDGPEAVSEFANKYRDCRIIYAHFGDLECLERAKYGNVFTDTGTVGAIRNNVLEEFVAKAGSERILFSTDTYSCSAMRGRIEFGRISQADKENILWKNAQRLFPKLRSVVG